MGILTSTTAPAADFPVQADAFNITKISSGLIGLFAILVPSLSKLFGVEDLSNAKDSIIFSLAGVMVAALFTIAIIVAADVRARATSTAAAATNNGSSTGSTGSNDGIQLSHISATGTVAAAKMGTGPQRLPVMAVGWDSAKKKTYFLLGQGGGTAQWQPDDQIATFYHQGDPTKFFPTHE